MKGLRPILKSDVAAAAVVLVAAVVGLAVAGSRIGTWQQAVMTGRWPDGLTGTLRLKHKVECFLRNVAAGVCRKSPHVSWKSEDSSV